MGTFEAMLQELKYDGGPDPGAVRCGQLAQLVNQYNAGKVRGTHTAIASRATRPSEGGITGHRGSTGVWGNVPPPVSFDACTNLRAQLALRCTEQVALVR